MGYGSHYPDALNARQVVDGDLDDIAPSAGFIPDITGTAAVRLRGETAVVAMPVIAGVFYPLDVAEVDISGFVTTTEIYILRRAAD